LGLDTLLNGNRVASTTLPAIARQLSLRGGFVNSTMSATDLRELRGILSGFSMTDIAQMKTAERRMTSLRSVKKPLDHAREDQLSLVFRPELTKAAICQIFSYRYENDCPLFDLRFLFLSALPARLETIPPSATLAFCAMFWTS
jgi:hypothetical protein